MQDYKELYAGSIKLYGAYVEERDEYVFRVELNQYMDVGLDCSFSGAASFYFDSSKYVEHLCKQLNKMYDTLCGECLIQDCEWGNTLKLYFKDRTLMIDGYFDNRFDRMLKFSEAADQTIIPHILSLFKSR